MPVNDQYFNGARGNDVNPAFRLVQSSRSRSTDHWRLCHGAGQCSTSMLEIYNDSGLVVATVTGLPGTNASVAQLDNGNLAIVYQDADSIFLKFVTSAGMWSSPRRILELWILLVAPQGI
ncbi:MAG: hypothetical protein R3D29_12590 [Nitratireductor sp.]